MFQIYPVKKSKNNVKLVDINQKLQLWYNSMVHTLTKIEVIAAVCVYMISTLTVIGKTICFKQTTFDHDGQKCTDTPLYKGIYL